MQARPAGAANGALWTDSAGCKRAEIAENKFLPLIIEIRDFGVEYFPHSVKFTARGARIFDIKSSLHLMMATPF